MRNNLRYLVPVRSVHWQSGDKPLRHIKVADAEEMIGRHTWEPGAARRVGLKKGQFAIQLRAPEVAEGRTEATITLSEMLNNAEGSAHPYLRKYAKFADGTPNPLALGNYIDEDMTKVELWPEVGDTKAVRVGPLGMSNGASGAGVSDVQA